jgi:hypothetical protein
MPWQSSVERKWKKRIKLGTRDLRFEIAWISVCRRHDHAHGCVDVNTLGNMPTTSVDVAPNDPDGNRSQPT